MSTYATDAELEDAIARRNISWTRMQEAREWLDATDPGDLDIRARRREYNACQNVYESACLYLRRMRVWHQTVRAAA